MQDLHTFDFQAYIEATLGNISRNLFLTEQQIQSFIRNEHIIYAVVATPKSGSTYLANILVSANQLPYLPLCYAYSSNEHDLYLPALIAASMNGAVSQLHMKGTPHNAQLLRYFRIRPIILTRNLYDTVESLARDLRVKCTLGYLGQGLYGYSSTWLTEDIQHLDDEQLIDFVIAYAGPWLVNFYVSWHSLSKLGGVNPVFVSYEEMMKDKAGVIARVITEISGTTPVLDPELIKQNFITSISGISKGEGKIGLGLSRLSSQQILALNKLLAFYPGVDFTAWTQAA